MNKLITLFTGLALSANAFTQQEPAFRNSNLTIEQRVNDLLNKLTLEEKISLLGFNNPAVDRLQIPAYNWWNEALHGVARAGEATVFPQAIAMAATFNTPLIQQVSTIISTEARAKFNLSTGADRRLQYMGLTFWSPNINIFRDPRWGRGQETYGEDPFLTASMGIAYIKGLQGDNPYFLKTAACAKHFAVHSGPESIKHTFNAIVDEKDLRETYLYAFKKLVDSGVEAVMCAYNQVNGEPCCSGRTLLQDILRNDWGFKGHVVTDCGALEDIWLRQKSIPEATEVAAVAVKAGINLECGDILQSDVMKAIDQGLLNENDVNNSLIPILRTRFKLGLFDDPSLSPFINYNNDSVNNSYHIQMALEVAQQSMVLLKNNGVLPLQKDKHESLMVVGANASSLDALMGSYHGVSGNMVTFVEGIAHAAGPSTIVQYDLGYDNSDTVHFGGIWAAQGSDVTIAVIGLTPLIEGEDGDAFLSDARGDKVSLALPEANIIYMKKLREAHNKPIIAVITAGSAVDISAIEPYADAIILVWYAGEQGGKALADIIFGKISPSGRLPITFYRSVNDIPEFIDYSMNGRSYRYFEGKVQYPFGFGLSYTSFDYKWLQKPKDAYSFGDTIHISVQIANTGNYDGDEVVQAYIEYPPLERMPLKELKGFKRVTVLRGDKKEVTLDIPVTEMQKWDLTNRKWKLYNGKYSICIGKNSNDIQLEKEFSIK